MISRPSKVNHQPRRPRNPRLLRTGVAGLFGPYHGQPGETGRAGAPRVFSIPLPSVRLVAAQEDAGPESSTFSSIVRRTETPMTGRKDGHLFGMVHAHTGNVPLTPRKDGDLFESPLEACRTANAAGCKHRSATPRKDGDLFESPQEAPGTANAAGCKHRSATGRKDGHLFRSSRQAPAGGEIPAAEPFNVQSLGLVPVAPGSFGPFRTGVFSTSSARFGKHNRAGGRGPGSRLFGCRGDRRRRACAPSERRNEMKKFKEWLKECGMALELFWLGILSKLDGEEREQREADEEAREREAWEAARKANEVAA